MPLIEPNTKLMVLMFTDLAGSVDLKTRLGASVYVRLISRHDELFKQVLATIPGSQTIKDTGDGFLARFDTASDAVRAALCFQHALHQECWDPEPVSVRIGLHIGQVAELEKEAATGLPKLVGLAADITARIMDLATPGQILMTRTLFDDARQYIREHPQMEADGGPMPAIKWMAHGPYLFKGSDEPLDVFEVGAVGIAPLKEPPDSGKAKRAVRPGEEDLLGWRPAIAMEVPGRPGWELQRKVGEGGFGEVWLARHAKTKEQRVFKFCFDPERLRSFKRELTLFRLIRESLGDRDDIARLIDVRLDKPPYFLESEFVAEGNLSQWVERQGGLDRIGLEVRLSIIAQTAKAAGAAHSLGIIHKDIKPSNIFIREKGDGTIQPLLADFGIGAIADRALLQHHNITEAGFTETFLAGNDSSRTGTRLYAPPETQVGKPATTKGDIYALGVMLYQFVIGDIDRPLATGWQDHVEDELLRADIAACVHGDVEKRLGSADELAERLMGLAQRRADLNAQRIAEAQRLDALRRANDQARRNRILRISLAVAAVIAVIVGGLAVFSFVQMKRADERTLEANQAKADAIAARNKEETQRQRAEAKAEAARRSDYSSRIALAENEIAHANIWRARTLLEACPVELRHYEWHRLRALSDISRVTLRGHESYVTSVALSADGKRIASGSYDDTVRVWDAEKGGQALLTLVGHQDLISSVALSADGKRIISGSVDKTIKVWDAEKGGNALLTLLGHEFAVNFVALSADGKRIVSASADKTIRVWDAEKGGEPLLTLREESGSLNSVALSADGKRIVSGSGHNTISVWDAENGGDALFTLRGHELAVTSVALSPDGTRIVSCSTDKTIKVWDAAKGGAALITLRGHEGDVTSIALSADGRHIVSGSWDKTIRLWDAEKGGQSLLTLRGHEGEVTSVAISADGRRIGSASLDNTIKVWDAAKGDEVATTLRGHDSGLYSVAFSADGKRIGSASMDHTVKVWDGVKGGEALLTLRGHEDVVRSVALSADGKRIVSGSVDGTIKVWDGVKGGEALLTLRGHEDVVAAVALSADGKRIGSGSWDGTIKVWDAEKGGEALITLRGHKQQVLAIALSTDGKRVVSGSREMIKVWDAAKGGEALITLRGPEKFGRSRLFLTSLALSADGKRIVSGSSDNTITVWDAEKGGQALLTLRGHEDWVTSVALSADGKRIVSASTDKTIRVWDAENGGEALLTLRGHRERVSCAVFSADGKRIASGADEKSIRVWDSENTGERVSTEPTHESDRHRDP